MTWWNPLDWFASEEVKLEAESFVSGVEIPTAIDLPKLKKLRGTLDALIEGLQVINEQPPEDPAPVDVEAWKTSVRNRLLASKPDSEKAALFGTLSTEPTATANTLAELGVPLELGADMATVGKDIRASVLALTAVAVETEKL